MYLSVYLSISLCVSLSGSISLSVYVSPGEMNHKKTKERRAEERKGEKRRAEQRRAEAALLLTLPPAGMGEAGWRQGGRTEAGCQGGSRDEAGTEPAPVQSGPSSSSTRTKQPITLLKRGGRRQGRGRRQGCVRCSCASASTRDAQKALSFQETVRKDDPLNRTIWNASCVSLCVCVCVCVCVCA